MCLSGLATLHPATDLFLDYAMKGRPAKMEKTWILEEMESMIAKGPYVLALLPDKVAQLQKEVSEKKTKIQ